MIIPNFSQGKSWGCSSIAATAATVEPDIRLTSIATAAEGFGWSDLALFDKGLQSFLHRFGSVLGGPTGYSYESSALERGSLAAPFACTAPEPR